MKLTGGFALVLLSFVAHSLCSTIDLKSGNCHKLITDEEHVWYRAKDTSLRFGNPNHVEDPLLFCYDARAKDSEKRYRGYIRSASSDQTFYNLNYIPEKDVYTLEKIAGKNKKSTGVQLEKGIDDRYRIDFISLMSTGGDGWARAWARKPAAKKYRSNIKSAIVSNKQQQPVKNGFITGSDWDGNTDLFTYLDPESYI